MCKRSEFITPNVISPNNQPSDRSSFFFFTGENMSNKYKAHAPRCDHINVGDTIVVTNELKKALVAYESASVEATLKNISERQAQAAAVVTELTRAPVNKSNL